MSNNQCSTCYIADLGVKLTLLFGSIFEQDGAKIIHVPQTFETSPDVVRGSSVAGQFVQLCKEKKVDIDTQIDGWCERIKSRGVVDDRFVNRKVLFKTGELCPVTVGEDVYCLAAFCWTDNVFCTEALTIQEYIDFWDNVWKNLSCLSLGTSIVNIVVPGGKLVNVGPGTFSIDQKLGVIVRSFFRASQRAGMCKDLRVCLGEEYKSEIEVEGWCRYILPYLYRMSCLPIVWHEDKSVKHTLFAGVDGDNDNHTEEKIDTTMLFLSDLKEMVANLDKANGTECVQFDGSKKMIVRVNVNVVGVTQYLRVLETEHRELVDFLGKRKGVRYDKNRMFQLLGLLHQNSTLFGEVNRRNLVRLCLGSEDSVPERWDYLGDNLDNIINYVGQRLTDLKKNTPIIYNKLVGLIPKEYRKRG